MTVFEFLIDTQDVSTGTLSGSQQNFNLGTVPANQFWIVCPNITTTFVYTEDGNYESGPGNIILIAGETLFCSAIRFSAADDIVFTFGPATGGVVGTFITVPARGSGGSIRDGVGLTVSFRIYKFSTAL